jgi:hypothetical protein
LYFDHNIDIDGFNLKTIPKNPEMESLETRKMSFITNRMKIDNFIELAEAGFYSIRYEAHVRCFHCFGKICELDSIETPWILHAKYFSNCCFLRANKSKAFIAECQTIGFNGYLVF